MTDEQIAEEMACGSQTESEAEILCIYRAIAEKLPLYNRFVMHGAAISFEDKAYIFTAERANQHISDFGAKHSEILSELLTAISL